MADGIKLYTPEQAAKVLQCTTRCVYNYLWRGVIPGRKIGGRWKIEEETLRRWIIDGRPHAGDPEA